jgi:deoxyribodipyrimidine photo-lyase
MNISFPTELEKIMERVEQIDPHRYAHSRNDIQGAVTYLSPYISRGVISTRLVWERLHARGFTVSQAEALLRELLWRDYFQRVAQERDITNDIRQPQQGVVHRQLPQAVLDGRTGIRGIDNGIVQLMETGYMHNHVRMYVAMLCCNVAGAHWSMPARWMYYHLLDGDPASNHCSWQWVAGSNSSKKYYANQENISRYTHEDQRHTYLDASYEELVMMPVPEALAQTTTWEGGCQLLPSDNITLRQGRPTLLYNYFNLDPQWHAGEEVNRVLLLEPQWYSDWPVHPRNIEFMLALARQIPGMQVFTGSFDEFEKQYQPEEVVYKEHPSVRHYRGREESRDWICAEVSGYYPSFFAYWKKVSRHLK